MKMMLSEGDKFCFSYDIGVNYIRLGNPDLAFPHLRRAVDDRCAATTWAMVDPMLDSIRADPRYNDLLRRMNLPH